MTEKKTPENAVKLPIKETKVAESNGSVIILMGSSEIAVLAHVH